MLRSEAPVRGCLITSRLSSLLASRLSACEWLPLVCFPIVLTVRRGRSGQQRGAGRSIRRARGRARRQASSPPWRGQGRRPGHGKAVQVAMLPGWSAFDVETVNTYSRSVCSLGVAATVDGELVARDWLVKPPGNRYDDVNTEVHGLTAKDTEDAPTFLEVWAGPVDAAPRPLRWRSGRAPSRRGGTTSASRARSREGA